MLALKIVLVAGIVLLLIASALPLIRKDHWTFRVFDYPRMQKFILGCVFLLGWLCFFDGSAFWYVMAGLLLILEVHLAILIYPFTPMARKMIGDATHTKSDPLSVLACNVYQDNRDYQRLIDLIRNTNPDIVFLVEVDQLWIDGVAQIKTEYPFCIEVPMSNTYGLAFYSKRRVLHQEVRYWIDDEVPSVDVTIDYNGVPVRVFGLHPTPPVPQENRFSTDRDAEILLVAKAVKAHRGPCLVIGDLNDVAWSYTTSLFLKISGMLDPRHGRGRYSTFHARHRLLRWPLDHFFVSKDFGLVRMHVEKGIGSDHFPISIAVTLSDEAEVSQKEVTADDRQLAHEKIQAGKTDNPR